jgi:hypothetical protein
MEMWNSLTKLPLTSPLGTLGGRGDAEKLGYLFPHLDCIHEPELLWLMKAIQMMLRTLL